MYIYIYIYTHTYIYVMEYYLAIKKNEKLPFVAKQHVDYHTK